MIAGLGVDLVELERFLWSWRRWGDRLPKRLLADAERKAMPPGMGPRSVAYLAGRFAAKEAVLKALGTGLARGIGWHDIRIAGSPAGEPRVVLSKSAAKLAAERRIRTVHLSISHTASTAAAVAVAEAD